MSAGPAWKTLDPPVLNQYAVEADSAIWTGHLLAAATGERRGSAAFDLHAQARQRRAGTDLHRERAGRKRGEQIPGIGNNAQLQTWAFSAKQGDVGEPTSARERERDRRDGGRWVAEQRRAGPHA